MMSGVLLDTGPIVSFLYGREKDHGWAVEQFATLEPPFLSCEPVVTEACFLVTRNGQSPSRVLDMLARGTVRIGLQIGEEIAAIRASMERYANIPMSLADARLVRLAEMTGLPVCTLDRDFEIYRTHGHRALRLIMPGQRHLHEP